MKSIERRVYSAVSLAWTTGYSTTSFVLDELHRAHVVRIEDAVVRIESLRARQVALDVAEVPLADRGRGVAERLERFGDGHLLGRQADVVLAGVGRGVLDQRMAERIAPGQDRRARGSAERHRHVEVGEADPLARHAGRGAASGGPSRRRTRGRHNPSRRRR